MEEKFKKEKKILNLIILASIKELWCSMISVDEARTIVLGHILPMGLEKVDLLTSLGRVIGEEIIAPFNIPPWDNSAMDGYAVRFDDIKNASFDKPSTLK
jgi:molybdopterin molybdotransferase